MKIGNNLNSKIVIAFVASLIYAISRYNIFGNVPYEEIPLYISNKAISLTIIFILLFSIQKTIQIEAKKKLWKLVFILSSIHVFISFRLLGPEHYKKFYFESELNLIGYITIFLGILIFSGLLTLNSDNLLPTENGKLIIPEKVKKIVRTLIPILIAGHLFAMGIMGWITPSSWPGYLLPISLIAFVIIVIYIKETTH